MDITAAYSVLPFQTGRANQNPAPPRQSWVEDSRTDLVRVSRDVVVTAAQKPVAAGGTKIINQTIEILERGYRRTQTFQQADGRTFTKVEEFTATEQGSRRAVIQQNPSGSTIRAEDVLDRQEDGTFRRTQRFADETGEIRARIETGLPSADPAVFPSLNGFYGETSSSFRGRQVDVRV